MTRLVLGGVCLTGCTLIDERTFNPAAEQRPTFPSPPSQTADAPEPGPRPLLTIRPPVQSDAVRGDIANAVKAARAVKRDVNFDVVTVMPAGVVGDDAAEIARLIVAQGVPASRVHLAARPEPSAARQVRVYVR